MFVTKARLVTRSRQLSDSETRAERLTDALRFMRERFARHIDDSDRTAISALLRDQEEGK